MWVSTITARLQTPQEFLIYNSSTHQFILKNLHYAVTKTHVFDRACTIYGYQLVREPTKAAKVKVILVSQT
jgi:hypothetical protein